MVYLLHLHTETHNSQLYTSEKDKNGSHGEHVLLKKKQKTESDSETEEFGAEIPCKFNLKCQGFYTDGDFNRP